MSVHSLKSIVILCATVFLTNLSVSHADEPRAPVGLWVWAAEAPEPKRVVDVERTSDGWRVAVNGEPASADFSGDALAITLPTGEGFTGDLSQDNLTLEGHWHQPANDLGYSDMVTPVRFRSVEPNVWRAEFSAQPRTFRVFLDIFYDDEEQLAAVLRNPERNEIMRSTRFWLEPNAEASWWLVGGRGERHFRQALTETDSGLLLDHNWFGAPLSLRRATESDTKGYFPRDPSLEAHRYVPPQELEDGWSVATAEEAGFSRAALDVLVTELATASPRNNRPRLIHSVLVAHKGRLIFEEYFHGYDREHVHDTRSLGKVFAPVLVGALMQQGVEIDANTRPIEDVLKAAGEGVDDPRKNDITLAQLMSFSSGLDCDINNPDSLGGEGRMWEQNAEPDFWVYTARLPLLHNPGERYAYCSGSINLVGASIRALGGKPIIDLFDQLIAAPLQFSTYHWNLAPNGAAYLGGGVYMKPRDILKIGVMHEAGGLWNGQQILPTHWVEESTAPFIDISPETTGMSPEDFNNAYFGGAAGYEWRIDDVRVGDRRYQSYEATGNGGQVLVVVPELELVALFMGGNYRQGGIWGRWRSEIIGGHIIPAMSPIGEQPN